jgi:hypothetical protein
MRNHTNVAHAYRGQLIIDPSWCHTMVMRAVGVRSRKKLIVGCSLIGQCGRPVLPICECIPWCTLRWRQKIVFFSATEDRLSTTKDRLFSAINIALDNKDCLFSAIKIALDNKRLSFFCDKDRFRQQRLSFFCDKDRFGQQKIVFFCDRRSPLTTKDRLYYDK